jgi:acetyl esterase/lipase
MVTNEKLGNEAKPASHGTNESVLTIPMRDGYESELRVIKPPNQTPNSPLVVLIYGGGFFCGTNSQLLPWAKATSALYNATVVLPSYRLAPEYKFPTAPNDIWDSVKWLAANAASLGADPSQGFVIGGSSAGGNLAVVTGHRALREKLSPPLTGVLANIPVCLDAQIVPEKYKHLFLAREQNADGLVCNAKDLEVWTGWWGPDYFSVDFSPVNSDIPLAGLPPHFVQVDGLDTLRDDGLIYEKLLRDSGVSTRLVAYPGMPHGHWGYRQHPLSDKAHIDTLSGLGWLLGQEIQREEISRLWNTEG